MGNREILKNIFDLKKVGINVDISNLPLDISREVVEKNLLQIELEQLKKNGGGQERINEINLILSPPIEEVEEVQE